MNLYTIGFTKKSAEEFFTLLKNSGTKQLIDVRLNNISQLAGFTKRKDLEYFLREIIGIEYYHIPELAPTKEILDAYKKYKGDWLVYEEKFLELMDKRQVEKIVPVDILDYGCLLCSEHSPEHCHRRLVAEYLNGKSGVIETTHL